MSLASVGIHDKSRMIEVKGSVAGHHLSFWKTVFQPARLTAGHDDQRGHPLKPRRPFIREKRPLGPAAAFMRFASAPDVVRELNAIADALETTPRERTNACELIHSKVVAGRRVRQLARQIAVLGPMSAPARTTAAGRQLDLALA